MSACLVFLCYFAHIHSNHPGDALFDHRNAVNDVRTGDGSFVVRDNNELGLGGKLADDVVEFIDVGVV